jgi:hypothetical protein
MTAWKMRKKGREMFRGGLAAAGTLALATFAFSQDDRTLINKSLIPAQAGAIDSFVPKGWKIEEQITGDLNGDGLPDYALKLIEDKPAKDKDDAPIDSQRALVVVLQNKNGKLSRAAVADKLLQCPNCGGAFYGVGEAPANVKIEKGAIVVDQDRGSRWVSELTYRFRYEPETEKFLLIGFDYASRDRAAGGGATESTNYLTGLRIAKHLGKKETTARTQIPKTKTYIEDVDNDQFDEDATRRLHLD